MAPPGPITTPLTSLLGIKHPIILAGMARVSGGRLAAAVSNAGGLGIIGGFQYTPDQLREIIAEMKDNFSRPDLPFGVDLALPQIGGNARKTNHDYTGGKLDELVDIIIDSGAKLFVSAVGVPPPQVIKRFHDKGILVMNMVGHPKHATKALDLGVDMVCAQGGEGGGHTGDVANSILIPAVADVASKYHPPLLKGLPALVVAAGGISSGRSLASSLMQGAVGVWVGTRFVASVEASCSEEHKKEVVSCGFEDTQRTLVISGRPLRMKTNDYIRKWHEQPDKIKELCDKGVVPIEYDFEQGNDFDLPHLMGQVAGAITKIQPAGEIVDEMVKEAVDMLKLGGTYLTAIPRLAALTMSTSSDEESYSSNTSISDEELDYSPCESCVLSTNGLENVFPALDTKTNQFTKMPDTDYILISLDFHHICAREPSISIDGPSYQHDPIIEAGVVYLDMRDILYDRGKGVMPGDQPVKTALLQLGSGWLAEPNVQIWDLKKEKQFQTRLQQPAVFELVLERLGIRFEDNRFGNLSPCSGNATIIENIITVTDNEVADKNTAHNEVINDKSTDDNMADDKMADKKISDNKTTEEITAEEKATEEEKIEKTSKDDEMTDAQHSDGESAEDEIVSLSVIRQLLFPDMPDLFFNAISKEDLGLPSQFHWPSAYEWLKKVTVKFHSKGENACKDMEGKKSKQKGDVDQDVEPCTHRVMFDCAHTSELAVPLCGVEERLWAMCGPLHGIEPDYLGIVTRAKRYTDKLEGRVTENAKVLGKLLEETPEPFISGKDKNGRPVTDKDLDYFIADLDYFVEVDDDGNEESETLDEEDEHNSDYELPPLDDFSHSPER
ncbi:hypothetical protein LZL87_000971 [Fusarium oxysporum]|nr:hypothetical protein LZL87_000971 [Fusarium oxysporum]